jgi:hypothetical protein
MALEINDIRLNRDDLAEFLPNLRSIKAFENLQKAITATIPDSINDNSSAIDALQAISDGSLQAAGIAQSLAIAALALAQDFAAQAQQIEQLRATMAAMQSDINDLKQGYLT